MLMANNVPTKFVSAPNAHLVCSVCKNVFIEPVINVVCGHTFCKRCITPRNTVTNDTAPGHPMKGSCVNQPPDMTVKCPLDAQNCSLSGLVVNRSVQSQIEDLFIYCRHGLRWSASENQHMLDPDGCSAKIKLGKRQEHEDVCDFTPVICPNNPTSCGHIRRKFLERHLRDCAFSSRKSYTSNMSNGVVHEKSPPTTVSPGDLAFIMTEMKLLKERVAQLETENQELREQQRQSLKLIRELTEQQKKIAEGVEYSRLLRQHSTPRSRSNSTASRPSSSTSSVRAIKSPDAAWKMPFQFMCIGTLRGHLDAVKDLSVYTERSLMFSAGEDNIIKVWELENLSKGCTHTLRGHTNKVECLCVDDVFLYSAGADSTLRAWSLEDLSLSKVIQEAHDDMVAALVCTEEFVFSSSHTVIKVWKTKTLEHVHSMTGLKHWVRSLTLSVSKDHIYSGSHNTVEVWDARGRFNLTGKISHSYGSVHSLAVTTKYIIAGCDMQKNANLSGTYNQNIQIFDVTSQKYVCQLSGHVGTITSLVASQSGRFLFSSSSDSKIQVWSLEFFLPIQILSRHEEGVNVVTLHNDLLLSGSDKEIKVYKYFKMEVGFVPS